MEKELELNNRKLTPKEQELLRMKIVRIAKKNLKPNGKVNIAVVSEICECSTEHVRKTWYKYVKNGISAIKTVKMGRPNNSGVLSVDQQKQIQKMIVDKCPEQLKLKGFLWDRKRISELVHRLFNVKLTPEGMGKYLKAWGFSAQRPILRNHKQKPEQVQKWLDEEYPTIKERAQKENAEINWADETGCQNETNYVKGYAPIGETPIMPTGNAKLRINMISAITNQGKLRYMFYRTSLNAKVFLTFLKRLTKESNRKIFLIVDNLKSHHAIIVREWLEQHKEEIELFFLPPYSPEYNPDEYLNGNLKREMAKKGYSTTIDDLETKARGIMKTIQNSHEHISNFFKAKYVKYAG